MHANILNSTHCVLESMKPTQKTDIQKFSTLFVALVKKTCGFCSILSNKITDFLVLCMFKFEQTKLVILKAYLIWQTLHTLRQIDYQALWE